MDEFKGGELPLAVWLLQEAMIPSDFGTRMLVAETIGFLAKTEGGTEKAAQFLLTAVLSASSRGERVNRFWFSDRKYLPDCPPNPGVWNGRQSQSKIRDSVTDAYFEKVRAKKSAGEPLNDFDAELMRESGI